MKIAKMFFLFCIVLLLVGCSKNPTSPEKKEFYPENYYVEKTSVIGYSPSTYYHPDYLEIDAIVRNQLDFTLHNPFLLIECFNDVNRWIGSEISNTPSQAIFSSCVKTFTIKVLILEGFSFEEVCRIEVTPFCDEGEGTKYKQDIVWEK